MSEESDLDVTDNEFEISEENHAKLVESITNLDDKQYIKKPTRTEPTTEISEFHLVNSLTGRQGSLNLRELTSVLKNDKRFSRIHKQVNDFQKNSKTLEKPLEKPQEEKLKRSVAYEKVKKELAKWDPIVTHNRAATNLSFPLVKDVNLESGKTFVQRFRIKSDIQKEMESLEPKIEVYNIEEEKSKFLLSMEEILERRQETAKLRAVQSYKAAKAKRENKIKSKKFHRVQRKEQLKKQLKEFEQLQKTNPDEALKKLEEIEKARAIERVTLRHKNTGKWAKNKQIRAKYDKESRQELAQQLRMSRDLTQKIQSKGESESEADDVEEDEKTGRNLDENNPWTNPKIKVSNEVNDFLTGYKKFWKEQNQAKNAENNEDIKNGISKCEKQLNNTTENFVKENEEFDSSVENNHFEILEIEQDIKTVNDSESKKLVNKQIKNTDKEPKKKRKKEKYVVINSKRLKKQTKNTSKKEADLSMSTSEWDISTMDTDTLIDNMSYIIQTKLQKKLEIKAKKLKKQLHLDNTKKSRPNKKEKGKKKSKTKYKVDLSLPSEAKRPDLDEEMMEDTHRKSEQDIVNENVYADRNIHELDIIMNLKKKENVPKGIKENSMQKDIDPNKFMNVKATVLNTGIPDLLSYDDNVENENQQSAIAEAFEDDEIIDDFAKEKQKDIEKEKPKDVDLTLPGWGSWGGTGIEVSKRKRKRFISKFPKKIPRKDDRKGNLIIKDNNKNVKTHLVSELPFPFRNTKDFEASIRAPVGNTFIPETAFRKNILPSVMTKIGTIIEPIDHEILLKKKKKI